MKRHCDKEEPVKKIVLATRNSGKIRETKAVCTGLDIEFLTLDDFPHIPPIVEDGRTFEDNAVIKAQTVLEYTGQDVLADDSGLSVDFLGGMPGVWSSRYAGEDCSDEENNKKLLKDLLGVKKEKRTAHYVCVLAFLMHCGEKRLFRGECGGYIAENPQGKGGFGYDPVFFLPEQGRTMAELSLEEKNAISHRTLALKKFVDWLNFKT